MQQAVIWTNKAQKEFQILQPEIMYAFIQFWSELKFLTVNTHLGLESRNSESVHEHPHLTIIHYVELQHRHTLTSSKSNLINVFHIN